MGSIRAWQLAHAGFARCWVIASRIGQRLAGFRALRLQRRNVRRRRRRRRRQQVVQHPFAAQHRRRPCRVRRERQDAALPQQAAARAAFRERDAPEIAALHVRNAVVQGEPLVDEGVVGGQQLEHAAVLAQDAVEEELGLAMKRAAQRLVEIGEQQLVRLLRLDVAQDTATARRSWSPSIRSADRRASAAPVARAPPGLFNCPAAAAFEQLVVRNAAPEKERQARGQLQIADAIRRARRGVGRFVLDAKQELRTHEHAFERPLNAPIESAFGSAGGVEGQQALRRPRRSPGADTPAAPASKESAWRRRDRRRRLDAGRSTGGRLAPDWAVEGRQTKIRRRLGVSPGPVTLYGPLIVTLASAGCVPRPRIRGRSVSSSRACVCSMKVTPTSLGPAFTGMRNSSGRSAGAPRPPPRPPRAFPPTWPAARARRPP